MNFGFGKLRRGTARGGLTCLAQARQNRPGIGELDLTELFMYWAQRPQDHVLRPYELPAIPQKGRDIEIILAHRGQRRRFRLAR